MNTLAYSHTLAPFVWFLLESIVFICLVWLCRCMSSPSLFNFARIHWPRVHKQTETTNKIKRSLESLARWHCCGVWVSVESIEQNTRNCVGHCGSGTIAVAYVKDSDDGTLHAFIVGPQSAIVTNIQKFEFIETKIRRSKNEKHTEITIDSPSRIARHRLVSRHSTSHTRTLWQASMCRCGYCCSSLALSHSLSTARQFHLLKVCVRASSLSLRSHLKSPCATAAARDPPARYSAESFRFTSTVCSQKLRSKIAVRFIDGYVLCVFLFISLRFFALLLFLFRGRIDKNRQGPDIESRKTQLK